MLDSLVPQGLTIKQPPGIRVSSFVSRLKLELQDHDLDSQLTSSYSAVLASSQIFVQAEALRKREHTKLVDEQLLPGRRSSLSI
ncbi:hypothetical protein EIP91_008058 [Steccherinum ochraceum]|uniref:Uncharacterized protein n=1 Tax=Steccherinum ochraceum TaxID=92696 RepID=A0A4R0RQ43_9APHY|nr:hypothetical protein EIP91_008058 [Steccherinum ochraceum]